MVAHILKVVNSKEHKVQLLSSTPLAIGHQTQAVGRICILSCISPLRCSSRALLRHLRRPCRRDLCLRQTNSGYSR